MKTINDHRTTPQDVEMKDGEGRTIYVNPDATIGDLVKAGVKHIGLVKPDAPQLPHWYRNT